MKEMTFFRQVAMVVVLQLGMMLSASAQSSETGWVKFTGKGSAKVAGPVLDFPGSQITFEAWVRYSGPETAATLSNYWLLRNKGANSATGFSLRYHKAGFYLDFGGSDGKWFNATKFVIDSKTWSHIAYTITDNTASLYINGVFISTCSATVSNYTNTDSRFFAIGNYNSSTPNGGSGGATNATDSMSYADVRIWNFARSGEEIFADFQKLVGPSSNGLVLNYNFANITSEEPTEFVYDLVTGRVDAVVSPGVEKYQWGKIGVVPTNLRASNKTATSFDLAFDGCDDDNKWEIEVTDLSSFTGSYDTTAVKTHTLTDLTENGEYEVRVRTVWPLVSEWSDILPITVTPSGIETVSYPVSIRVKNSVITVGNLEGNNSIAVYSAEGLLLTQQFNATVEAQIDATSLGHGLFLVKVNNSQKSKTFKVVL